MKDVVHAKSIGTSERRQDDGIEIVSCQEVSFHYPEIEEPVLHPFTLSIYEGDMVLVVGSTGAGKSTFLRLLNGLVPHFSGGLLRGKVETSGRDSKVTKPRDFADVVGFVPQNPIESFLCETVEEELAYAMENIGVDRAVMRRRVEETLDLLSIEHLRHRFCHTLSGGEQQRVAIAAVLTAAPKILVLDEPTSALDPASAEEVLAALHRLVIDVGLTVVLAEHRIERVLPFVDSIISVDQGVVRSGTPQQIMQNFMHVPPIIEIGRLFQCDPLPLSIRDARRVLRNVQRDIALSKSMDEIIKQNTLIPSKKNEEQSQRNRIFGRKSIEAQAGANNSETAVVAMKNLCVSYERNNVLRGIDISASAGCITGLMGRNGAGKSTILRTVAGLITPDSGHVEVQGYDPKKLTGKKRISVVGFVPQDCSVLLYGSTVKEECESADHDGKLPKGTTASVLDRLGISLHPEAHPRSLSEGQKLSLALAIVMAHAPSVLVLDEPTRGLDYVAKKNLVVLLQSFAKDGMTILLASHDVEFIAMDCDRVYVLGHGEVIAEGLTRDVVRHSQVFSPQVAKIFPDSGWVTVREVQENYHKVDNAMRPR